MHGTMRAVCAAAIAALVAFVPSTQAADSVVRQDSVTGFTFSEFRAQYVLGGYITYGVAVPSGVAAGTPYDVVLQVTAPVDVGWAGLAWGGSMTSNPLAVSWQNGDSAIVSSRFATYVVLPLPPPPPSSSSPPDSVTTRPLCPKYPPAPFSQKNDTTSIPNTQPRKSSPPPPPSLTRPPRRPSPYAEATPHPPSTRRPRIRRCARARGPTRRTGN
jgi:hypothetical protein